MERGKKTATPTGGGRRGHPSMRMPSIPRRFPSCRSDPSHWLGIDLPASCDPCRAACRSATGTRRARVGHRPVAGHEFIPPGVACRRRPARAAYPIRLRWAGPCRPNGRRPGRLGTRRARPGAVPCRLRIARAVRCSPVSTRCPVPPTPPVIQRHRPGCRSEDQRTRHEIVGACVREVLGRWRDLGGSAVIGGLHKAAELGIGHRALVDEKFRNVFLMGRTLLGIVVVTAHHEAGPGRHFDHVLRHPYDTRRCLTICSGDRPGERSRRAR